MAFFDREREGVPPPAENVTPQQQDEGVIEGHDEGVMEPNYDYKTQPEGVVDQVIAPKDESKVNSSGKPVINGSNDDLKDDSKDDSKNEKTDIFENGEIKFIETDIEGLKMSSRTFKLRYYEYHGNSVAMDAGVKIMDVHEIKRPRDTTFGLNDDGMAEHVVFVVQDKGRDQYGNLHFGGITYFEEDFSPLRVIPTHTPEEIVKLKHSGNLLFACEYDGHEAFLNSVGVQSYLKYGQCLEAIHKDIVEKEKRKKDE